MTFSDDIASNCYLFVKKRFLRKKLVVQLPSDIVLVQRGAQAGSGRNGKLHVLQSVIRPCQFSLHMSVLTFFSMMLLFVLELNPEDGAISTGRGVT